MDYLTEITTRIIKEQELIIGPLAWEEARMVSGLKVDILQHAIEIEGEATAVVNGLVKQYERLFGRASVEVCKDAVKDIITNMPKEQVPSLLK